MTKTLTDVIEKRHDKEACRHNCEKNGKLFNHPPYQCRYFTNDLSYNDLLVQKVVKDEDYPVKNQAITDKEIEKLIEFADTATIWDEMKVEVALGCRKDEDVTATEKYVEEL